MPITLSTLLKIEALVASGAEVVATDTEFVDSDPAAVAKLRAAGVRHIPSHADVGDDYDVVLDCCAELAHVTPRLGTVEITRTGHVKYEALGRPFPVVSVDASRVKRVEDALGSSDGFMRALAHFAPALLEPAARPAAVVFGYGKVGVGIAHRLAGAPRSGPAPAGRVTVVDVSAPGLARAAAEGHTAIAFADTPAVLAAVAAADLIVTCTGVKGIIADNFPLGPFCGRVLANIGAEDEFGVASVGGGGGAGERFAAGEVLFGGRPCNFALEEPTTIGFLDPAFVAHNEGIAVLQAAAGGLAHRVHDLPLALDADILDAWLAAHPDEAGSLERVVGMARGEWRAAAAAGAT